MAENKSGLFVNQDTQQNINLNSSALVDNVPVAPIEPEFKFGTRFEGKKGSIDSDILNQSDKAIICLYFASSTCYLCKGFTPKLIEFYNEVNTEEKLIEIVLVPFDKSDDETKKYFRTMPWISLPFDLERIENYRNHFNVKGIPQLVVLKKDGSVLVHNAVKEVRNKGEDAFIQWQLMIAAEEESKIVNQLKNEN